MNRSLNVAMLYALLWVSAGCAVGQKIAYHDLKPEMQGSGSGKVAVAVLDHRSNIVNGTFQETYVGNFRAGVGIPYPVTTESGNPLAYDLCTSLRGALADSGFTTVRVDTDHTMTVTQVVEKMKRTGADRCVLFLLSQWMSITYQSSTFLHKTTMWVTDPAGNVLAKEGTDGERNLGRSMMKPGALAKKRMPKESADLLETLLNEKSIRTALGVH